METKIRDFVWPDGITIQLYTGRNTSAPFKHGRGTWVEDPMTIQTQAAFVSHVEPTEDGYVRQDCEMIIWPSVPMTWTKLSFSSVSDLRYVGLIGNSGTDTMPPVVLEALQKAVQRRDMQ